MGKVHNVFHVSLLEPFHENTFSGRIEPPPLPITIEDHFELEVTVVLDSKYVGRTLKYLVRWKGYGPANDTWEPWQNLRNAQDLVNEFHSKYPAKLKRMVISVSLPRRGVMS
jgi:hypothetical protein